jgi:beta-N-acetylhexosaminidase
MTREFHRTGAVVFALLFTLVFLMSLGVYAEGPMAQDADALSQAEALVRAMTLKEKIGQMFMVDFRRIGGQDVRVVNDRISDVIKRYRPGGVILFRENTVGTLQTLKLTCGFQKASPKIPLLMAIDQEGGAVTRLQSGTVMPGNMALGAAGNPKLVGAAAKAIGDELKALGINMNFAPVADVNNNPANPVIGVRSFSDDPETVARLGVDFMRGLHEAGVIAVAKHFPGHGDTATDSHIDLPTVPHDLDRLEKIELVPFHAMIQNGIDTIMTAHVTFPAVDDRQGLPATLSANGLTGLLRGKMGFQGVIITDAFNMKAITERYGDKEAAYLAVTAGVDMILMPQDMANTFDYILKKVEQGEIAEARIDESVKRILALKIKYGIIGRPTRYSHESRRRALRTVGSAEHAFIRRTVAERAVTLVKNEDETLPFKLADEQHLLFFAPSAAARDRVSQSLHMLVNRAGCRSVTVRGFNYDGQRALTDEQRKAVAGSDYILLFTRTTKAADLLPGSGFMPDFAADLIQTARTSAKKLAAVAVRNPYDIRAYHDVQAYLAVYTDWEGGGVEAAVKAIFGEINPVGKLPVAIPDSAGQVIYPRGHGLAYALEKVAAVDGGEWYDASLNELWAHGLLDNPGAFRPDRPIDGQKWVQLLRKMLLVTQGRNFHTVLISRNKAATVRLFVKAGSVAGLEPGTVRENIGGYLQGTGRVTQAEMAVAAERFFRLLKAENRAAQAAEETVANPSSTNVPSSTLHMS